MDRACWSPSATFFHASVPYVASFYISHRLQNVEFDRVELQLAGEGEETLIYTTGAALCYPGNTSVTLFCGVRLPLTSTAVLN